MQSGKTIQICFILMLIWQAAWSQTCSVAQMELEGSNLVIYYDLIGKAATPETYLIQLFSSHDNYAHSLKHVRGDIGIPQSAGSGKKIILNILDEYGTDFEEKVNFKVKASVYVPFINLNKEYTKIRRDKAYELTWTGPKTNEPLKFELLNNDLKLMDLPPSAVSESHYTLKLPRNLSLGGSYRIKITEGDNENKVAFTQVFSVLRKIPLSLKAIPLVVVGAAVLVTSGSGSSKSNQLPDPIKP